MPQTTYAQRHAELDKYRQQLHADPRYKGSAVELLERAQHAAKYAQHARLEAVHLLFAMIILGNGAKLGAPKVPADLCRAGASRDKMIAFFEAHPELKQDGDANPVLDDSFIEILREASKVAWRRTLLRQKSEMAIGHRDVLVALLRSSNPLVRGAIDAMGIDRSALLKKYRHR